MSQICNRIVSETNFVDPQTSTQPLTSMEPLQGHNFLLLFSTSKGSARSLLPLLNAFGLVIFPVGLCSRLAKVLLTLPGLEPFVAKPGVLGETAALLHSAGEYERLALVRARLCLWGGVVGKLLQLPKRVCDLGGCFFNHSSTSIIWSK